MWDYIGPAQIVAVIVLLQRGLEELLSMRNTSALLERGAREEGGDYYPVVAVTHLSWIAALFFMIPVDVAVSWFWLGLYGALQIVRYWIIATLGGYWTHRIITLPGGPIERRGPYKFVRHPNYVVTILETLILPFAFGEYFLGVILTAIWGAVLYYKILLEDAALAERRQAHGEETV